ncbi:hypothetical protein BDQ17DRAFT_1434554 [Cyathus striatus]|nr:hypothetical protein BDQ17DRAFT_1434554 [Cyathus striatus]
MQPPIRGYDLLVTSTTIVFGMTKSVMAYTGYNTGMTTVEWVGSAVVGVAIYWLGLYESNPLNKMPYLFTTDYKRDVQSTLYSFPPSCYSLIFMLYRILAYTYSRDSSRWIEFLRDEFLTPAYASETSFKEVTDTIIMCCFAVHAISLVIATLGASIFVVLVIVLSRFRLEMLEDNATFLGYYVSPIFFVLVLDLSALPFLLSLFTACLSLLPILPSLEENVISLVFIFFMDFISILGLGTLIWWLGKFSVKYLSAVVRLVSRAVLGWYAVSGVRRRESMGV